MSLFGSILNIAQSLPGYGIESSFMRKTAGISDRLDNSAAAAGALGAMGPATFIVEPDILKTVVTGDGPSPVKGLGWGGNALRYGAEKLDTLRGSATAAGMLGAAGPLAFWGDSKILNAVIGNRGSYDYGKPQSFFN